ncbi:hypothetical protein DIURU_003504 [Diutina rugosa]|uniref:Patatin-like phospholipase domain-containing protein n=1 Tax=Diutina rugosa TaxID=5481 RepID=A0A642USV0_DIURU|nr:uncharacterized protein DIURU_003504 [Diutina rugosa]KAA8901134.1 hypothetical protein DIURU_003504 [Diutina rugosa]
MSSGSSTPQDLWDQDYVNDDSIEAFAQALKGDGDGDDLEQVSSSESASPQSRISRIISRSDWAPLRPRVKRKAKAATKRLRNEFRSSASYHLLRWPLLVIILLWILLLCIIYSAIRVYVALSEYFFTWVGYQKQLRDQMRSSKTFGEWKATALELDNYLRYDKWSFNPRFSYYDYKTVALTIKTLRKYREANNHEDLMIVLQGCVKHNFAGIENRQLYSHRYYGTKNLVDEYVQEVTLCIDIITYSEDVSLHDKRKFFKIISKNYGKAALVLSGGACFAYTHFGIVKALLEQDLLPDIISGTSGGGLIAALACTYKNDELKELLVPELADKITACEEPWYKWIPRFWRTGARFDAVAWASKSCFFCRGDTTFQEAFERTGRKLNISTVPADPHSPVILCNNITSPNCIIWSSLLASAAVPGILNPVVLMMKNRGKVGPFSLGNKWRDGSLRTDVPLDALNSYYNVTFSVVSQVNPHIALFFFAPKGTVGRPVARRRISRGRYSTLRGGFVATALEQLLKLEITKWLQLIKTLDILPHFLEQDWSNIWLQKFTGSVTIWPRFRFKDFWYILSDPNREQMQQLLLKGERSMWPRVLYVRNRMDIERAIERGRKESKLSTKIAHVSGLDSPISPNGGASDFTFNTVRYADDLDVDVEDSGGINWAPPQDNDVSSFDESYFEDTDTHTTDDESSINDDSMNGEPGESPVRDFINEVMETDNSKFSEITHRRHTIY